MDYATFLQILDTTVRLANLRSGELDMIERLAATDAASVKADDSLTYADVVNIGYMALYVNIANGALADNPFGKDKRLRQAFSLAIDREALNQVVAAQQRHRAHARARLQLAAGARAVVEDLAAELVAVDHGIGRLREVRVAHAPGQRRHVVAVVLQVQVGTADAAAQDPEQDLPAARLRLRQFGDGERFVLADHGLHGALLLDRRCVDRDRSPRA